MNTIPGAFQTRSQVAKAVVALFVCVAAEIAIACLVIWCLWSLAKLAGL